MQRVEIYGQSGCHHCVRAVIFCSTRNIPHVYRDIARTADKTEMFRRNPAAETVPQIFIGDTLIGGADELVAMDLSKLQQMIGE